jgi:hypothetical protein
MIFDSQISVGILHLVYSGIFVEFKNFIWFELLLNFFREMPSKEILFGFMFRLMLFEKLFKDCMWVTPILSFLVGGLIRESSNFESPSRGSDSMNWVEEWVVEIE